MSAIACIGVPVATRALAARRTAGTAASARSTTVVVATRGAGASPPSARLCGKTSAVVAKRSLRGTSAPFVSHAARGDATRTSAAALEVAAPVDGEEDAKKQLYVKIVIAVAVAALALAFPCASLAAAKAKGGAVVAAGPIPFLPYTHNQILHAVNLGSLPAWFSLVFLPRWRHTKTITLFTAVAYSLLYVTLAYVLFSKAIFSLDIASFSTTAGIGRMFSDATAVLAGWAHFIVFDLWTARFFVMDSASAGIPHLLVVPCILACMFFGPLGLVSYVTVRKLCQTAQTRNPLSTKTFKF